MEEKIISHFLQYQPKAILLYGSRASDYAKPNSDWDVVLLSNVEQKNISTVIDGQNVDADVILYPISDEKIISYFNGTLQSARTLYDPEGIGQELIKRVQNIYAQGRNLSGDEVSARNEFLERRFKKLLDNVGNSVVFAVHLGVFIDKAIQYWFEVLHNRWRTSLGTALGIIQTEDPEYAADLENIAKAESITDKIATARKIYNRYKK
jgi:hypothetical protein